MKRFPSNNAAVIVDVEQQIEELEALMHVITPEKPADKGKAGVQ